MISVTRYEVTLNTRDGRRVLTAWDERAVVLMAESVMRRYEGETLCVGVMVACSSPTRVGGLQSTLQI